MTLADIASKLVAILVVFSVPLVITVVYDIRRYRFLRTHYRFLQATNNPKRALLETVAESTLPDPFHIGIKASKKSLRHGIDWKHVTKRSSLIVGGDAWTLFALNKTWGAVNWGVPRECYFRNSE